MPASVTVEGGGSGSYLDCFSDASLAIAVYNPDVLGVYLVCPCYTPYDGQPGMSLFDVL